MPGVIMCEAAAQLASYYAGKYHAIDRMVGLGGLEEVRFRDVVRPGNRFVIVSRLLKPRRAITTCEFQCFVNRGLVCEDILKGGGSADGFVGPPVPVSGPKGGRPPRGYRPIANGGLAGVRRPSRHYARSEVRSCLVLALPAPPVQIVPWLPPGFVV